MLKSSTAALQNHDKLTKGVLQLLLLFYLPLTYTSPNPVSNARPHKHLKRLSNHKRPIDLKIVDTLVALLSSANALAWVGHATSRHDASTPDIHMCIYIYGGIANNIVSLNAYVL